MATQSVRIGWRPYVNVVTQVVNAVDADAQAFIAAAGITNLTQASAINTLVNDLKTYGLWTKMKALYPMVGGSATSHKFNLKDPRDLDAAFRLVFNGGWTHTATGTLPNGTTGYADTKLIPQNVLTTNDSHLSFYSRSNTAGANRASMGSTNSPLFTTSHQMFLRFTDGNYYGIIDSNTAFAQYSNTNTTGYYVVSRKSNNSIKAYKNSSLVATNTTTINPIANSHSIFIGARSDSSSPQNFDDKETAFASIGDGLTDTEAANFYTSVQKFQTTLGRQIGSPIVSDTDAQAFINAAGLTDSVQANAVNTLVVDLKAAGVWTKMKALYPFVGGTATTHKFNLKDPRDLDAAFRLVFNGGWTHSTTGALPNGTTGYADTKLTPSVNLGASSAHFSYYSRTATTSDSNNYVIGAGNTYGFTAIILRNNTKFFRHTINNSSFEDAKYDGALSTSGLFLGTQDGTNTKLFRNATIIGQNFGTDPRQDRVNIPLFIGAENVGGTSGTYTTAESSFASIGDSLTDTEASAFYTAVQKYQTTLGRQV